MLAFRGAGYPLRSPDPPYTAVCGGLADERVVGVGFGRDRALEQTVEEQPAMAGSAPVEAEGELVEVVVELGAADGALVGAEHPALEQRGDEVYVRHARRGRGRRWR